MPGRLLVLVSVTLLVWLAAMPLAVSAGERIAHMVEGEPALGQQQLAGASPIGPDADRPSASLPVDTTGGVPVGAADSVAPAAASRPEQPVGVATRSASASALASITPSPSPSPASALATDTVSLFGFVCEDSRGANRIVYSRNPAMEDPADSCRTARSGEVTIVVTDPANLNVRHDSVQTGPDGYANAVVPVGRPFVLVTTGGGDLVTRQNISPVYRLNTRPDLREPISVRVFQVSGGEVGGTPAASDPTETPTGNSPPGAAVASQLIMIQGMICVSESRAGIYDYLSGAEQAALSQDQCRRATVDEMEFLLLDNDNPSQLYDDQSTGIDGIAVANAPIDRPFFVTEFNDDPGIETGLPGGSAAITIPADPAGRQPVVLTVVRNVAPGALDLPAGTMMLSTVVCPSTAESESLTVLGPASSILIRPDGAPPGTPQPGSGDGCEEATGQYRIAPYGDEVVDPVEVSDGAGDGALIVPLPATLTLDGTRVFDAYRITETSTGQTATFDIQEGAYTSLRVVLVDRTATPVADDKTPTNPDAATPAPGPAGADDAPSELPGTPGAAGGQATGQPDLTVPATAPVTATPDETGSGGMSTSPVRLLWAALAALAIGIFLAGAWVLRRPGHRWRR